MKRFKKIALFVLSALAVGLLISFYATRTAAVDYYKCGPGTFSVYNIADVITVTDGTLRAKFYTPYIPDVQLADTFAPESLPGMAVSHGWGGNLTTVEGQASDLAADCFVTLIWDFRGQGPHQVTNTEFDLQSPTYREDLLHVADTLIEGPITSGPNQADLVRDDTLGIMGYSQSGKMTWDAIADVNVRGRFQVAIPQGASPFLASYILPNDCMGATLAGLFAPNAYRTPWPEDSNTPTPTETRPGASWDSVSFPALQAAYLTPNAAGVSVWATALYTREPGDEFLTWATSTSMPGYVIPHPHVYAQCSWYDYWGLADECIAGFQTVTPPASGVSGYPRARVHMATGQHAGDPWEASQAIKDYRAGSAKGWLHFYLGPFYDTPPTPTPTPNGGQAATATNTPWPVEYVVDYFSNSPVSLQPIIEVRGANNWPPAATQDVTLYLNSNGQALTVTPPSGGTIYDTVSQTYLGSTYNIGTAVAEAPAFADWDDDNDLRTVVTRSYVTALLNQDVLLVGPPEAFLFVDAYQDGARIGTYQLHVYVEEQLDASNKVFVSRANDCAWEEATPNAAQATPTPLSFTGDTRAHLFRANDRIIISLVPADEESYSPTRSSVSMQPVLDDFSLTVYRQSGRPSSVELHVVPTNSAAAIFQADSAAPGQLAAPQGTPTPLAPEPLQVTAELYPNFTNDGGWRSWAPEVWFTCTGGEGAVTCPVTEILTTDGVNQTFTYTATDTAGHEATVTLTSVNIDRTPPVLSESLPESQTFCSTATLSLDYALSDALSGLGSSNATFNGEPVVNGQGVPLLAGMNTLSVFAHDVAGNMTNQAATIQVNYNTTLDFPTDGGQVNPLLPLAFAFQVNDACLAQGWYGGASADLWLINPSGQEQPAEWYGLPTGNSFVLNSLTGWYEFDADLTGLAAGTWTARADLDDGTSRSVTFVIPAAGPNTHDTATLIPAFSLGGGGLGRGLAFDCAADLARDGRYLGGCR